MQNSPDEVRDTLIKRLAEEGSLTLDVKVVPRSAIGRVEKRQSDGQLTVRVRAAPENGKANAEVAVVLGKYLEVAKGNVEVVLGHSSRQKRIRILC